MSRGHKDVSSLYFLLFLGDVNVLEWCLTPLPCVCSCRGLDPVCDRRSRRGDGRGHPRQIRRVWRDQEPAPQFGQKDGVPQGKPTFSHALVKF